MKVSSQPLQENSRKFSRSEKPQKSETELLLDECGEVLAKLKKEKVKRARVFVRVDKTDGFFDTANSL